MADQIDRGQASGEVRGAGNPHGSNSPGIGELGVAPQRLAEWRDVRDAGEEVIEQALQGALGEGRAPTKADIQNHVRGTFGTGENEWYTPPEYIEDAWRSI